MVVRRVLVFVAAVTLGILSNALPDKYSRPVGGLGLALSLRGALSRQGRRLSEIVGSSPLTLYLVGVPAVVEYNDGSAWLILGDHQHRFRAVERGRRRYELDVAGFGGLVLGVTRRTQTITTNGNN